MMEVYFSPLEQFNISPVYVFFMYKIPGVKLICETFGYYPFLTNSIIYSFLSLVSFYMFFYLPCYYKKVYPSTYWEFIVEKFVLVIQDIISQSFASKNRYENYIPFLVYTFFFILFSNILGLTPFGFTNTSFLLQTFILSSSFLIALTIFGIGVQGGHFFEHFVPKGVPKALIPMLVVIEVISYVAKAFSLAIRLFANMMSGHTLLNILSSFSIKLSKISLIIGLVPFIIVLAISFLEVGISFLQAYVFMVLLTLYFNDSFADPEDMNGYKKVYFWKNLK